ncbi:Catabolite control protein A [Roseivivax jejudonensis]|uniref:Catabolite control protein A n=1 Tax=Roseivivax jejudonensis TaxID=1529041 RepID=A0A1X6Y5D7_9RHOB|nr:LacI family DNA-binding transcriptional regulator [Roseivivax jejudonensis]SLN10425.1 Catabolite control protein A [Roseivivax jejudonensis]
MNEESDGFRRPTTKDIARFAGVSRATVDRVLNDREGVRQPTIDKVHEAIRELGFVRNVAAANLATGRSYRFLHLLPRTGDQFIEELERYVSEAANAFIAERIVARVERIDMNDPHLVAAYLSGLDPADWDGVAIMAPRSPQVRDAVFRLSERGLKVMSFVTSQEDEASDGFVGIDNRAAGATAGLLMGRFLGERHGTVAVLAETMTSQDSLNRRYGFDRQIGERFSGIRVPASLETYGDPDRTRSILSNICTHYRDLCGLYILSAEARIPLEILREIDAQDDLVVIAHERTAATVSALREGRLDALITQDPGHLARSVLRRLKAKCDGYEVLADQERIRTEILMETNL